MFLKKNRFQDRGKIQYRCHISRTDKFYYKH